VIVDSAMYANGQRVDLDCAPHDYATMLEGARAAGGFVWLGLYMPSSQEFAEVAEAFHLHPLAVEDAVLAHQRPKLERYDDSLFLVLKTLWYVDAEDAVETGEVNVFLSRDFVVTVRHGRGAHLAPARHLLEGNQNALAQGPSSAVYAIADHIVDGYLRVVQELTTDVDEVETSVFSPARTSDSARIYALKREIAEVRRAVLPLREPVRRFAAGEIPGIDPDIRPFFRDVLDHLNQAADTVDSLESLLSSAFDAHLAQISVQQNDDMRKISAGAALVVVPTFIAGVYGMNFTHMPELSWTLGYPFALLLMAVTVLGLWIFFRKSGWM
jgi:magnesium transporter